MFMKNNVMKKILIEPVDMDEAHSKEALRSIVKEGVRKYTVYVLSAGTYTFHTGILLI